MIALPVGVRVWLAAGSTDMRNGAAPFQWTGRTSLLRLGVRLVLLVLHVDHNGFERSAVLAPKAAEAPEAVLG